MWYLSETQHHQLSIDDSNSFFLIADVLMGVYRGQKVAVKRSKRGVVGGVADELLDEAKFVVWVTYLCFYYKKETEWDYIRELSVGYTHTE